MVLEGMLGEAMDMLESVKMRTGNWPDGAGLFLASCLTCWGRTFAWTPSSWSKSVRSLQRIFRKNIFKTRLRMKIMSLNYENFEHMLDDDTNEDD